MEAVCASKTFAKAPRLQTFLRYVSEATLRGDEDQVKESVLAAEVFGRSAGYDPQQDSVVRRQAHALRQKLRAYYEGEGKGDNVHVELPVGRYIPSYRRGDSVAPVLDAPRVRRPDSRSLRTVLASLATLLLLAVPVWWFAASRSAGTLSSAAELWAPFLRGSNGPLLCFATRRVAVVRHYPETGPLPRAPESELASEKDDARFRRFFELPSSGGLYLTPSLAETKVAEAMSAVRIATLLGRLGKPLRTTESRFMSWDVLRREDVILLGDVEGSPWVNALLRSHPVKLRPATGHQPGSITVDGRPDQVFTNTDSGNPRTSYALVSLLPGIGPERRVLLVVGLTSWAAQVAADYLTTPEYTDEILVRLRKVTARKTGPWHFQLVLETELRDSVPISRSIRLLRPVS